MTAHKRIRRIVLVPCPDCLGTGRDGHGGKCPYCVNGEVPKVIVEIVNEVDGEPQGEPRR